MGYTPFNIPTHHSIITAMSLALLLALRLW